MDLTDGQVMTDELINFFSDGVFPFLWVLSYNSCQELLFTQ